MGSRKRVIALVLVILFFFPLIPTFISASPDGESWLVGWTHRKSHVINPASGAGVNYQVKINVYYGPGTDGGENVYCNGSCRADFGDIRFTDNDGTTLLDYWIEDKIDAINATFWVEIADDLGTELATVYIYYGNNTTTSTSNGSNTFLLYDDFEDGDVSDWSNASSSGSANISATLDYSYQKFLGSYSMKLSGTDDARHFAYRNIGVEDYVITAWVFNPAIGPDIYDSMGLAVRFLNVDNHYWFGQRRPDPVPDLSLRRLVVGVETTLDSYAWSQSNMYGDWEKMEFRIYGSQLKGYVNDSEYLSAMDSDLTSGEVALWSYRNQEEDVAYFDNVFVRKYVDPEPSHGGWGSEESTSLPDWSHRKSHVINPAPGAGTNYQIRIVVHYGAGTDSGESAYCDSQCRTDFGDIRFTDDDGVTELDYWMEEKVDGDYAVFWIEVADDLSTSSAMIYVYYGNPTNFTTSNGPNTFLVFDDFEDGDTAGWTAVNGSFTASTDYSYHGNYSGKLDPTVSDTIAFAYQSLVPNDYCMVAWIYCHQRGDQWDRHGLTGRWTGQDNHYSAELINQQITIIEVLGGSGSVLAGAAFPDSDKYGEWNKHEFRLDGPQFRYYMNGTEWITTTDNTHAFGEIGLKNYRNEPEDIAYFDVIYVRKYTEPEPQHGIWGSPLPPDGQLDLTFIIIGGSIGFVTAIGVAAFLKARSPRPEVVVPKPRRPIPEPAYEEEITPEEITPEREEAEEPRRLLPSDVLCSYCGHVNPTGAKYCIRCGRRLG
ncbi:MAG: DUF2341 domain-containing protein [Candidatus Hodarchaeota archaeon]